MRWNKFYQYYGYTSCSSYSSSNEGVLESNYAGITNILAHNRWFSVRYEGLVLKAGESIKQFNGPNNSYPLHWSIEGPFAGDFESPCSFNDTNQSRYEFVAFPDPIGPECDDLNPCPSGQKCVNGECVDCDNVQATHFRFRFEFENFTTFSDGTTAMYWNSLPIPISSLVENFEIKSPNHGQYYGYVRVVPCDASGQPRLYKGNALFYLNTLVDDTHIQGFLNYASSFEESWKVSGRLINVAEPLSNQLFSLVRVDSCSASAVINDPDCNEESLPLPTEPPEVPPTEPVTPLPPVAEEPIKPIIEPLPPEEPAPWPEPWEPPYTPPDKPLPPDEPETNLACECRDYFNYIAKSILKLMDVLHDGILSFYDLFNSFFQLLVGLINRIIDCFNLLSNTIFSLGTYFVNVYREEKEKDRQELNKLFRLPVCLPEYPEGKTITQVIEGFTEKYEPALIEVLENEVMINQESDTLFPRNHLK